MTAPTLSSSAEHEDSALELRDLQLEDLDAVLAIERQSQGAPWSRVNFAQELSADYGGGFGLFHINPAGQGLLAFLIYRHILDEWELLNVVTDPRARRKGYGLRMTQELILRARAAQAVRIMLEVRSKNTPAISLYRKLGFAQDGLRRAYYHDDGDDALLMSMQLKSHLS